MTMLTLKSNEILHLLFNNFSSGNFGLWLDGDLYHGRNHPCKTFGNTLLTLREDFVVKNLECWGFIN